MKNFSDSLKEYIINLNPENNIITEQVLINKIIFSIISLILAYTRFPIQI
jgi:hypothetical protein